MIEKYVRNCAWARDAELRVDPTQILCESYKIKEGSQLFFDLNNPLELIGGRDFFREKRKLFDQVVGFAKFAEFLIVAEVRTCYARCISFFIFKLILICLSQYQVARQSLELQVSLDGQTFASGMFPPNMRPEQHVSACVWTMFLFINAAISTGIHYPGIQHNVGFPACHSIRASEALVGQHSQVQLERNVLRLIYGLCQSQ